jgi:biotin carboxyl carrier protein
MKSSEKAMAEPSGGNGTFRKFITRLDGVERPFEVAGNGDHFRVLPASKDPGESKGPDRSIHWISLGHGRHLFTVDGRPYPARIQRVGPGEYAIEMNGRQRVVRASDEVSSRAGRASESRATGPVEILAPMPGTIIQVMVADGDPVVRGQALFTIEAMKMQNEISAPTSGVVADVRVEPGQAVEARFRFCRIVP